MNANRSTTGSPKTKKLSKLFFCLLVQSKVLRIRLTSSLADSRSLTGYGSAALTRHLNFSTRAILSSKTLKRNSRSSTASLCKFSLLIVQTKSEHFLSRPTMSNKVLSAGLIAGKTLSAETYTKKPRHSLKT